VKNALFTIRHIAIEESIDNSTTVRPGNVPVYSFRREGRSPSPGRPPISLDRGDRSPSVDGRGSESRGPSHQRLRSSSDTPGFLSPTLDDSRPINACDALVSVPFDGT